MNVPDIINHACTIGHILAFADKRSSHDDRVEPIAGPKRNQRKKLKKDESSESMYKQ